MRTYRHIKTVAKTLLLIAIVILLSFLLSILIFTNTNQVNIMLLSIPLCLSVYLLHYLVKSNKQTFEKSKLGKEFATTIELASRYNERGLPLPFAIDIAVKNESNEEVKKDLEVVKKKYEMGVGIGEAINNSKYAPAALRNLEEDSLKVKIAEYKLQESRKAADIEGMAQIHSTLNVFVSTILPAFTVFGFVGSSIIAPTNEGISAIAIVMVAVLPLAYTYVNLFFNRRAYG